MVTESREHLLVALRELREELAEVDRDRKSLVDGIAAMESVLRRRSGTKEQSAAQSVTVDTDAPRGREAVETILREHGVGVWVPIKAIAATLVQRGWTDSEKPVAAARTNADRLLRDDPEHFERHSGKYRVIEPKTEPVNNAPSDDTVTHLLDRERPILTA